MQNKSDDVNAVCKEEYPDAEGAADFFENNNIHQSSALLTIPVMLLGFDEFVLKKS